MQIATNSLSVPCENVHSMEITQIEGESFFLFLDIFVHWTGKKITAVAPFYGEDINWSEYDVDLNAVTLHFGDRSVSAKYIPHRLDSWEPAVLFDFESPELTSALEKESKLNISIEVGKHKQSFCLNTSPAPTRSVAMSVIIKNENRWIQHYLDYYLMCLQVSHIFVYDNKTADTEALEEILDPYITIGKVTYIPWHYRWRNRIDNKQIGQPAQQAHTLNKYGTTPWIGFFDVDEFLRIPNKTLPEFIKDYDPNRVDGLSFDIRWFMYKGDLAFEHMQNPLFSFLWSKKDVLDRKRQKLLVSAKAVRFLRFHWLEEGKTDYPITDPDIFFHHYYVQGDRFEKGKEETGAHYDDYMLRFLPQLADLNLHAAGQLPPKPKKAPKKARASKSKQEWVQHVRSAFTRANQKQSKLDHNVLSLYGMCGDKNRHLFNNLCNFEGCEYIEIGSLAGASLCSALYHNDISATAIDNWSQFGGPKDQFQKNVAQYKGISDLTVIEQDCFEVDISKLPTCNVFYYDGEHSKQNQYRGIEYYQSLFDDYTILIVDDWNWQQVREGSKEAIAKLGLKPIYEKEIILPQEDVDDMPRHKGAKTWWNGIYVAILEKAPLSKDVPKKKLSSSSTNTKEKNHSATNTLARFLNPANTLPLAFPTPTSPLEVLVFSKDRACQLDALLRSTQQFLKIDHRINVLFKASEEVYFSAYQKLMNEHPSINWIEEENFREDLLNGLSPAFNENRFVMFLVDDIVFTRTYTGGENLKQFTQNEDILTISLRLGSEVSFCHPRNAETKPFDFKSGNRWEWMKANSGYWNYPMSVDGNIFKARDILPYIDSLSFTNPNNFEATMSSKPIQKPYMMAEKDPFLVNLALNIVQTSYNNPCGDIEVEYLNTEYLNGERIDYEKIIQHSYVSCHISPALSFMSGKKAFSKGIKYVECLFPVQANSFYIFKRNGQLCVQDNELKNEQIDHTSLIEKFEALEDKTPLVDFEAILVQNPEAVLGTQKESSTSTSSKNTASLYQSMPLNDALAFIDGLARVSENETCDA